MARAGESSPTHIKLGTAHNTPPQETSMAGFGNYRCSTHYMDKAAELLGPQLRSFLRSIKRAIDPNGILAPGKSGIHL